MEEALESTTPFLTIDPMVSDRLEPVHSALCGGDWKGLIHNDVQLKERLISQGVEVLDNVFPEQGFDCIKEFYCFYQIKPNSHQNL